MARRRLNTWALSAAAFAALAVSPAIAQNAVVRANTGAISLIDGQGTPLIVNAQGQLLTTGGAGGGGGGTVTQGAGASAAPWYSYQGQYRASPVAQADGTVGYVLLDSLMRQRVVVDSGSVAVSALPTGSVTTTGALQPPTAAAGKITQTSVAVAATTSTQLVAANANRIAMEIQCDGTAIVGVDRNGGTLTGAATAGLVIPAGSYPLYTFPIASQSAVTAYTATAQTCRVTEYNR